MSAAPAETPEICFHCGLEVPPEVDLRVELSGAPRAMCCIGCLAVAEMLVQQGLESWYETRARPSGRPADSVAFVLASADYLKLPDCDAEFATRSREDAFEVSLLVEGVACAACVWIIERHLSSLPGVLEARVNLASHRAHVAWRPDHCDLQSIIRGLAEIGFVARPDRPDQAAELERRERRQALMRIGIAGLATMNVMTYAVALYAGAIDGMPEGIRQFLRFMCWLVATPVVVISARPFFEGAWRDLRVRRPGMDVPVSIAILGAYLVSAWAVVRGEGEVYFESVCMFTFFLGAGRFIEMNVRHRAASLSRRLLDSVPLVARRVVDGASDVLVPIAEIAVGDRVRVLAGEALPVDGCVVAGRSAVEEALLTGESWPRRVEAGSSVVAGSVNAESPLVLRATRIAQESTLAALVGLIERAQSEKPRLARLADRVASRFVVTMLGIALLTAIGWALVDPSRVVWVTLSVLVATCPCALGLATPAALAAATEGLARIGFLVTRGNTLETLAKIDRVVFDKTGTLTRGETSVERVVPLANMDAASLLARAQRLEAGSSHVLARAFGAGRARSGVVPDDLVSVPGQGVEAKIDALRTRIGRPEWALELAPLAPSAAAPVPPADDALSWVLMADEHGPLAWFGLGDPLREEARDAVSALRDRGLEIELLSGDPSAAAARLAADLGLAFECPAATPEGKLARLQFLQAGLQAEGRVVAVVGDGLNDGPLMRAADVSIAMGGGCDLTRISADAVLLHDDLTRIPQAIDWAKRARRVIRQNFGWAIAYNVSVLPLAIAGQLPPWLAALGMSLSSLVVVMNAARLRRGVEAA